MARTTTTKKAARPRRTAASKATTTAATPIDTCRVTINKMTSINVAYSVLASEEYARMRAPLPCKAGAPIAEYELDFKIERLRRCSSMPYGVTVVYSDSCGEEVELPVEAAEAVGFTLLELAAQARRMNDGPDAE